MSSITIDGIEYKQHPIYQDYYASRDGRIFNSIHKALVNTQSSSFKLLGCDKPTYQRSRLIYEAYNGVVNGRIFHRNNDSKDNRLENLYLKPW